MTDENQVVFRARSPGKALLACASVCLTLASAATASAVLQPTPGGFTIPRLTPSVTTCSDNNVERCLDLAEGDASLIDSQADALTSPEVFQPTCSLTFKPITKGGGDHVAFGWYNIKEDPSSPGRFLTPTQEELFGMMLLAQGNTPGAQLSGREAVLNLAEEASAGRYEGGAIGFFLAAGPDLSGLELDPVTHALSGQTLTRVFFTQHSLNPGSGSEKTFFQVLTWQSVKSASGFYFGWEDRQASASSDNDFDDLVFLVTGIQCTGGGEACDTGLAGVCKDGTQQCKKGKLECAQSIQASPEKCNALDDDCNSDIDDGEGLCGAGEVCDRGRCVPQCGTGEFRCAQDLVCTARGVCVEPSCAMKECPAGQICKAGKCVDGCAGVACPYTQVCRNGGCMNPCDGIDCDEGYSCELGVCRSCECSACEGSRICHQNVCVDAGCEDRSCAAGSHCAEGACVDDCAEARCPTGQVCAMGSCVADPTAAMGATGGGHAGGSIVLEPGGAGAGRGGSSSSGGDDVPSGRGQVLGSGNDSEAGGGCGCRVPARASGQRAVALILIAGAVLAGRRRRRP